MLERAREVRKALVSLAGVLSLLLAQGLIPEPVDQYVSGVLGVLTVFGVYHFDNGDADTPGEDQAGPEIPADLLL